MASAIVMGWIKLIENGLSIENVPARYQPEVEKILKESGKESQKEPEKEAEAAE